MNKYIIVFSLLIFIKSYTIGQDSLYFTTPELDIFDKYEDTLAVLSYTFLNDSIDKHRFAACKKFIPTLVKILKTENSFHYPFERVRSVSILYPPDSTFRIFSWQLFADNDTYHYYGAIQMNTPELTLFPLRDRSDDVKDIEMDILSPKQWYGTLYYNLIPVDSVQTNQYILFGYDGHSFFRKRKVADILSFKDGTPTFGAPIFEKMNKDSSITTVNRLCLEYSAEAAIRLNYDENLGIIIHDHLIEIEGAYNQGPILVPDGSYVGYRLEQGQWKLITKVYNQILEKDQYPRPHPILDEKKKKDIFGN